MRKFSFAFPLLLLDTGHARKNTLATISDITQSQGTHLEGEGKVDWELKVFAGKERGSLTGNQHSSSSSTPTTNLLRRISNFFIERHSAALFYQVLPGLLKRQRRSGICEWSNEVAQKIPENPDFIQTCHNLLPQVLRCLSRKFPFWGGKCIPFLVSSHWFQKPE